MDDKDDSLMPEGGDQPAIDGLAVSGFKPAAATPIVWRSLSALPAVMVEMLVLLDGGMVVPAAHVGSQFWHALDRLDKRQIVAWAPFPQVPPDLVQRVREVVGNEQATD